VDFDLRNPVNGELVVHNRYNFISLDGFILQWRLLENGRAVQNGSVEELSAGPGRSQLLRLWENALQLIAGREYFLDLHLVSPEPRDLLPAGHEYARAQFPLPSIEVADDEDAGKHRKVAVKLRQTKGQLALEGKAFSYRFDLQSGLLSSIEIDGRELMLQPLAPNFWRAPTDNDFGNYMQDWAAVWEQAGANRSLDAFDYEQHENGAVEIIADYVFADDDGRRLGRWQARYSMRETGELHVMNHFERADGLPVMPRVGMNMELRDSLDTVTWYGRGPHENYRDRKLSAHVGVHTRPVADLYVPYMRPQENGYRTDVRELALYSQQRDSSGLSITADSTIGFSAHNNRMVDFIPPVKIAITSEDGPGARENTERVNIHVNDVKPRKLLSVNLDYGQMGVGGDDSWGKRTLQAYSLNELSFQYGFTIAPGSLSRLAKTKTE